MLHENGVRGVTLFQPHQKSPTPVLVCIEWVPLVSALLVALELLFNLGWNLEIAGKGTDNFWGPDLRFSAGGLVLSFRHEAGMEIRALGKSCLT